VPVNCGALPENLLESELFGHVRGAFTGAIRDKKGRFELADGGTIFLDEIGDLTQVMQVKLLRVLQEGTFERVGGEKTLRVDVRVISATHKNLRDEVVAGRFREDLFYRLSVVPLTIPPLRERGGDLLLLAAEFLKRYGGASEAGERSLGLDALRLIESYSWPGNVRELQNALQYAVIKATGPVIGAQHLPPTLAAVDAPPVYGRRPRLSRAAVETALRETGGNRAKAASRLGVSRATLYRFFAASET
jgi:transcriptional regulator with GAF, ATPase, and Fis domain